MIIASFSIIITRTANPRGRLASACLLALACTLLASHGAFGHDGAIKLANAPASPAVEATQASPKRALLAANTQAVMAPEARDYHLPTLFETIVVSGTRTPKTLEDSPVPIDIISAEDLHVVTTGTLANALEFIPGVVISRSIGKEGYNVMMQGFDSDRVLVLV
ncbi:MAG TPA: Plug domain-containing protein, partial [Marinagarivorans sp.]